MNKIKAGIIGSTGYAGQELFRILSNHKNVEVKYLTSMSFLGKKFADVYQNFNKITDLVCSEDDTEKIAQECDVIFLALPHGIASKKITKEILNKCKVIDLGADFRLKNVETYKNWYEVEHFGEELLDKAVYGLCEIHKEKIKTAQLVANPGCYTTCSILTLYPLTKEGIIDPNSIVIDAKSGVSGAGRSTNLSSMYCECNESIKAYKIASHRHTPEIEQELSLACNKDLTLIFTPHLTPMNRGILATCYAKLAADYDWATINNVYKKYYQDKFFVRLLNEGNFPQTSSTKGSNFIDIGFKIDKRTNSIIALGAIDNLIKGAAGQAVQNMNLMFGFDEKEALTNSGIFPI